MRELLLAYLVVAARHSEKESESILLCAVDERINGLEPLLHSSTVSYNSVREESDAYQDEDVELIE